jgi:hypothetical protein
MRFINEAQATVENGEIVDSSGSGVEIERGANPSLRQVRVLRGKAGGIVVHSLGGGTADQCEASGNAGGDWVVADGARLVRS